MSNKYSEYMSTAGSYKVSCWDPPGLPNVPGDWYVFPLVKTRDSKILCISNFEVSLKYLGGESKTVQVHRFGHWGPGWFEVIIIHPKDLNNLDIAVELVVSLLDYPVLCESDYCEELSGLAERLWDNMSMSEKIDMCKESNISIFSARKGMSELHDTEIYNKLTQE